MIGKKKKKKKRRNGNRKEGIEGKEIKRKGRDGKEERSL